MKEKLSERIDRFMNRVLGIPPTLEELYADFPHGEKCSRSKPLIRLEKEELAPIADASGWASVPFVRVINKYLECDECHAQARFIE